jgi:chromosome partitioning protein
MTDQLLPDSPQDFEKLVALLFQQLGFTVIMPPANTQGYDIEIKKENKTFAVQVKKYKAKTNIAQLEKFQHFLTLPLADRFDSGVFVSSSGYSQPALTHIHSEKPNNLILFTYDNGKFKPSFPQPNGLIDEGESIFVPSNNSLRCQYFGVFTCKGGVGKTTTAAHLAGAFALMGHDVILLDLDPDKNLRKLFLQNDSDEQGDASLYVPPVKRNQLGATITVLNHNQWREEDYPDVKVVICDCSPVLSENPRALVERFDYCLIPTTLNPLGIAKNSNVITRTFEHIRSWNKKADMFCMINSFDSDKVAEKHNSVLLAHLQKHIDLYAKKDAKCHLIHPDEAKIRYSRALLNWGYHIIDGSKPQLAFKEIAGKSYPRTDFLQLAEYLESHTDIEHLRQ